MNARLLAAEARHYPNNPRTRALRHIGQTITHLDHIADLPATTYTPDDWEYITETADIGRWFADAYNAPWYWELFDAEIERYLDRDAAGRHTHPRRAAKALAGTYREIRLVVADDEEEDAADRYLSAL